MFPAPISHACSIIRLRGDRLLLRKGILPARPKKPRDKANVEAGVRFAQTYILGRLRGLTFFSLAECNAAIALVMQRMNERVNLDYHIEVHDFL